VDADNIILETVKRAEDSDALILRLYETWNRATDCSIRFGRLMEMAAQCDMPCSKWKATGSGCISGRLKLKP
jgi:alpha-mannosidase